MLCRLVGLGLVAFGLPLMALSGLVWFFVPMTSGLPPYFALVTFVIAGLMGVGGACLRAHCGARLGDRDPRAVP